MAIRDANGFVVALDSHERLVVGTNLSGVHGKGAAKTAAKLFGLRRGVGFGMSGQSFAIPTKEKYWMSGMPLEKIQEYVSRFLNIAREQTELTFIVTPIGCGFAGYKPEQIAPMFANAPENVMLPEEFLECL